jgi:hypothetical protein
MFQIVSKGNDDNDNNNTSRIPVGGLGVDLDTLANRFWPRFLAHA